MYNKPLPAVYALISQPKIPDICLSDLGDTPLQKEVVSADGILLHILVKVLCARYVRSRREDLFTSQGKHYVQVEEEGDWLTCLELQIRRRLRQE